MSWFKPKFSVCKECKVHFEPADSYEQRWGNLCPAHRKAVRELDEKRDAAMYWAHLHWELIYDLMLKDNEKVRSSQNRAYNEAFNKQMNSMAAAQQNNMGGLYGMRGYDPFDPLE